MADAPRGASLAQDPGLEFQRERALRHQERKEANIADPKPISRAQAEFILSAVPVGGGIVFGSKLGAMALSRLGQLMKLRPNAVRFNEAVRRNPNIVSDLPDQATRGRVVDAFGSGTRLADDVVSELPTAVQQLLPLGRTGAVLGGTAGGAAGGAAAEFGGAAAEGKLPSQSDLEINAIAGALGPAGGAIIAQGSRFFARLLTQLKTPRSQKEVMEVIRKEREAQDVFEEHVRRGRDTPFNDVFTEQRSRGDALNRILSGQRIEADLGDRAGRIGGAISSTGTGSALSGTALGAAFGLITGNDPVTGGAIGLALGSIRVPVARKLLQSDRFIRWATDEVPKLNTTRDVILSLGALKAAEGVQEIRDAYDDLFDGIGEAFKRAEEIGSRLGEAVEGAGRSLRRDDQPAPPRGARPLDQRSMLDRLNPIGSAHAATLPAQPSRAAPQSDLPPGARRLSPDPAARSTGAERERIRRELPPQNPDLQELLEQFPPRRQPTKRLDRGE